ncbi:MAG: peroxiredoxin [Salinivirgaceae bacterium]|jgi:peroxiredoxin (alkyl hydroperoxide reductase subunit C)|nr:peroxiredoxin [Salinivirgaceae bacterium]MDD4747491.1 peroxiredoxin [Salinivirgaceae bacterium]MDY0280674.1 peroxiredoxin [Salinivirgaceae bacterium]
MLVGKKAPKVKSKAVLNGNTITEDFTLDQFIGKKNVVFFFYPADFTFVCPTELIAFQDRISEFKQRDTEIVACSTDSEFSHWKWLQTERNQGGIKGVTYPLVADSANTIAENYGVLAGRYEYTDEGEVFFSGEAKAYRGLFLIDKEGVVRHVTVNDMPLGRSVDEVLRIIDALQYFETNGDVCPANWHKGDEGVKPTQAGISEYLAKK